MEVDYSIIEKTVDLPNYKRYYLKLNHLSGFLVLEKYNQNWNLELINVHPPNKGGGSLLLKYVLLKENLDPKEMTVCSLTEEATRFFSKFGFIM